MPHLLWHYRLLRLQTQLNLEIVIVRKHDIWKFTTNYKWMCYTSNAALCSRLCSAHADRKSHDQDFGIDSVGKNYRLFDVWCTLYANVWRTQCGLCRCPFVGVRVSVSCVVLCCVPLGFRARIVALCIRTTRTHSHICWYNDWRNSTTL